MHVTGAELTSAIAIRIRVRVERHREALHLDVVKPGAHDALQQLVCRGIGWRAYEDARLWGHIRQAAQSESHHRLNVDSSGCKARSKTFSNSMLHCGMDSMQCKQPGSCDQSLKRSEIACHPLHAHKGALSTRADSPQYRAAHADCRSHVLRDGHAMLIGL